MSKLFIPGADGKFNQQGNPEFSLSLNDKGNISLVIDGPRETVCAMLLDAMKGNPDAAACLFTAVYMRANEMGLERVAAIKKLSYLHDNRQNGLSSI